MNKEDIIKKHWPKPSQSDSITAWKEAIVKMMDEWGVEVSKFELRKDWVTIKKDPFGEIFQHISGTVYITGTWNGKGMEYSIKELP